MKRTENMMHLQTIQSEESAVHFEHDLSTTGPHVAILIKESLKERPG